MALITYVLNGGTNNIGNPDTFVAGDLPITLERPTQQIILPNGYREGYIFLGWYLEDTFTTRVTEITVEADVTLYAKWYLVDGVYHEVNTDIANSEYIDKVAGEILGYNDAEGGRAWAMAIVSGGELVRISNFKDADTFGLWTTTNTYMDAFSWTVTYNGVDTIYPQDMEAVILMVDPDILSGSLTDDQSIYFVERDPAIYYITNGGSAIYFTEQAAGTEIVFPKDPTKIGLHFGNWYFDTELTLQVPVDYLVEYQDYYLNASWYAIVTYESNGGSVVASENVSELNSPSEPVDPTRPGYTFDAWYTDDSTFLNEFNFETASLTEDITLYADWDLIVYNITYNNLLGIAQANPATYTVEDLPLTLLDPTETTGYTFSYWSGETEGAIPVGTLGDISLTAVWSAIGDFIALPVYEDTTNLVYKVNKNYIVEVKAVPSDYKYRVQLVVSPGALIKLYPIYDTKAEAQAAADAFLASLI